MSSIMKGIVDESEQVLVLYIDGVAATKYVDPTEAKDALRQMQKEFPRKKIELRTEIHEEVELDENLHKWFKEKWVRFGPDGKIRGDCARGSDSEGKPKCLPQKKAQNLGKKGRKYAASKKRREDPNPDRHGPAKNVATKKKTNEEQMDENCWKGYHKEGNKKMFGKTVPNCVKNEGVAEGSLNESAYEEAWELISQPVPEIQQFVKQLGLAQDDTTAKQIAPMIDATPDTQLPAASIPKLKNLANKGNDVQTLKAIQQISGRPDAAQQYAKIMQARDAGEGRQRGYDVSGLINSVKSGNYEAPVLLKLATGTYVIGGRTRLYAALALGIPAKVKIISGSTFAKQGQQGVAEEKCPHCGGELVSEEMINEKQDACYYKVKSRYKVWPSAYASGALVQCRKKGAKNWGTKSESVKEAANAAQQAAIAINMKKHHQKPKHVKENQLNELFDKPLPIKWTRLRDGQRGDFAITVTDPNTGKEVVHEYELLMLYSNNRNIYDYADEIISPTRMASFIKQHKKHGLIISFNRWLNDPKNELVQYRYYHLTGDLGPAAAQVLATVMHHVVNFVKNSNITWVAFTGGGESRRKLYPLLAKRVASQMGWRSRQYTESYRLDQFMIWTPALDHEYWEGWPPIVHPIPGTKQFESRYYRKNQLDEFQYQKVDPSAHAMPKVTNKRAIPSYHDIRKFPNGYEANVGDPQRGVLHHGGKITHEVISVIHKDESGTVDALVATGTPVRDDNGTITSVVFVQQDGHPQPMTVGTDVDDAIEKVIAKHEEVLKNG